MNPGDEVIVPEPLYANYLGFAVEAGLNVVPIPTSIENGFALPSVVEFAKRLTPKTRAILVCSPSNPTGAIYSKDQLEAIRDIVKKHDLFLIGDEVYREFNYTEEPVPSVLQLDGIEQNVILADSVSKRYSLCGARVGFLVSRNKAFMDAALRFGQARLCAPTLEQIGVEAAIDAPASYFEAVKKEYLARRDLLVKALSEMPDVVCPEPKGAFYAMVRLPIDNSDRFCQWLLEEFRDNSETVMLAPGTGFYATPGMGEKEVRIAYVLNVDELAGAMKCLKKALEVYPGRC